MPSCKDELEKLREEVERQKKTIEVLLGTANMEVVTDDVLVLYHMQLNENQLLRQRLESLQQQLLNVHVLWSWMLISSITQIISQ